MTPVSCITMSIYTATRLFVKVDEGRVSVVDGVDHKMVCSAKCPIQGTMIASNKPTTFITVCDGSRLVLYHRPVPSVLKQVAEWQSEDTIVFAGFHPCSIIHLVVLTSKGQLTMFKMPKLTMIECPVKRICSPQDHSLRCKSASFVTATHHPSLFTCFALFVLLESGEVMLVNPVLVQDEDDRLVFSPSIVNDALAVLNEQLKDIVENEEEFAECEYEDQVKTSLFLKSLIGDGVFNGDCSQPQGPFPVHPEPTERLLSTSAGIHAVSLSDTMTVIVSWCRGGRLDLLVILDRLSMQWNSNTSTVLYLIDSVSLDPISAVAPIHGLHTDYMVQCANGRRYLMSCSSAIRGLLDHREDLRLEFMSIPTKGNCAYYDDSRSVDGVIVDDVGGRFAPFKHSYKQVVPTMMVSPTKHDSMKSVNLSQLRDQLTVFKTTLKKCTSLKDPVDKGKMSVYDLELIHQQLSKLALVMDSTLVPQVNECLDRVALLVSIQRKQEQFLSVLDCDDLHDSVENATSNTTRLESRANAVLSVDITTPLDQDLATRLSSLSLKLHSVTTDPVSREQAQLRVLESIKRRLQ